MRRFLVGIDVGTTYCKALVLGAEGEELGEARERTPWTPVATGGGVRGAVVRSVRESRLGPIEWSPVQEATARGAALLAGSAVVDVVGSGLR